MLYQLNETLYKEAKGNILRMKRMKINQQNKQEDIHDE